MTDSEFAEQLSRLRAMRYREDFQTARRHREFVRRCASQRTGKHFGMMYARVCSQNHPRGRILPIMHAQTSGLNRRLGSGLSGCRSMPRVKITVMIFAALRGAITR